MNWVSMIVTMLIIGLLMIAGHYFPWRLAIGKELGRVQAYIYGVLAIALPLTMCLIWDGYLISVAALWLAIVAGGGAVVSCYLLDTILLARVRAKEAEERERGRLE